MTLADRIAAIEARADAATKGPWHSCGARDGKCSCKMIWSPSVDQHVATAKHVACVHGEWGDSPELVYGEVPQDEVQANTAFIAAARTDVPALCAALKVACEALQHTVDTIDAVRREEREACAKVCQREGKPHTRASENADVYAEYERVCLRCAAAIRAMNEGGSK
jgi:hypothetical protein